MKVLVVGAGAREHALCWALRKSPRLSALSCAPGNAGTAKLAANLPIGAEAIDELVDWALEQAIDLVVVGPEAPLAAGLVDRLTAAGLAAFGPTAAAARIETSKCWSAEFVQRHAIPAPRSRACTTVVEGLAALAELGLPVAIKADGLAAGKGVVLAADADEARRTLAWMLEQDGLGPAGRRVLLQEALTGAELSVLAFADGQRVALMPPARDYKRIGEQDRGPNTGGMGACCTPRLVDPALLAEIEGRIMQPAIRGLAADGASFRGVLYAGLMLTADGPRVLEFNCRFGDPETQVILPLLETDLLEVLAAAARGRLDRVGIRWSGATSCGVVLASQGYPGGYPTGRPIRGLDALPPEALVFHAGTVRRGDEVVTAGGRVLTAVGLGASLEQARQAAYDLAGSLDFEGCYYRRDIGADDETAGRQP